MGGKYKSEEHPFGFLVLEAYEDGSIPSGNPCEGCRLAQNVGAATRNNDNASRLLESAGVIIQFRRTCKPRAPINRCASCTLLLRSL
jgi:hypothetical protein